MPCQASGVKRSCFSGCSRAAASLDVGMLLGRPLRALLAMSSS